MVHLRLGFRLLVEHWNPVTSVALSEDDSTGYSASKDGSILCWDVESGEYDEFLGPSDEILEYHGLGEVQGRAMKHSKQVLALAVSPDSRYLASGGPDRHVHLWDIRTGRHVRAMHGHQGPVSCLTFRQGGELCSGSFDGGVFIWNAERWTSISGLYGHRSDVLTIDSLGKQLLTVGRDRTMRLHKVPELKQDVFQYRGSSLECCCFIREGHFLSGSDDGNIELWKTAPQGEPVPAPIVTNAHAGSTAPSWVSSVAVCRSRNLAASGAGNGTVRLWDIDKDSKAIKPSRELSLDGFVNSLAFAKSGKFLIAGVAQEPRLGRRYGRPDRIAFADNGVALHEL